MAEKEDLALEILTDFLNAVEAGIAQAKQRLKEVKAPDKPRYDMSKIPWEYAEGGSGPYERSEDVNNLDFKELLKDLELHNGKFNRDGYFIWKFEKSAVVGRKLQKR